ncbi:DUF6640 family protein [Microbacterium sp. RD1]|uniref:DUF6640 family protein n=1 Tax=Microbacterium sp. RD1 TaxID=3457313 RepID=UPI003FA5A1CE
MSRRAQRQGFPLGKAMMSVAAVGMGIGVFVADFNKTHIYNDEWTPHAKFHTGQTMSMGLGLALATLYSLWGRPRDTRIGLDSAAVTGAVYHVSQLTAALYPGTATADPPRKDNWTQLLTTVPVLVLTGLGYVLERRRMTRAH